MVTTSIEITRTHDGAGRDAPLTTTVELAPEKWGHTAPDSAMKLLRPMRPSRTTQNCVYAFDSHEHGKGTIHVSLPGWLDRERMDEKVQMLEIERVLGCREPGKISDTAGWMYGIRLQVRNPYVQILFGLMFAFVGCLPLYSIAFVRDMDLVSSLVFAVLGIILVLGGLFGLSYRGLRRVTWWHRARAEVRRRGDKMPYDLRMFG